MKARESERLKKILTKRREELISSYRSKLSRSEEALPDGVLDSVDEADISYNKEFWYSLSDSDRSQLKMIEEAIQRLAEGNYGLCVNCGKNIEEKRLSALPWARHCLKCQDLQDRGLLE